MPAGFMSERTAEYVLVPDIMHRLRQEFSSIVPFYYWASREGSVKVAHSYSGHVRVVAAYARRPKIDQVGQ